MTCHAAPAIGAKVLEKSILGHVCGTAKIEVGESTLCVGEGLESRDEVIETLADGKDACTQQKKSSGQA